MRRYSTAWFLNKTDKEKEAIRFALENNTTLQESLLELIRGFMDEENRAEVSLKDMDNPNWAYLQANRNGAKRAYSKIEALFKTVETNTK